MGDHARRASARRDDSAIPDCIVSANREEYAVTDRKKSGVAFWATVVVVVTLAYPISFGPACWIGSRIDVTDTGRTALMYFYYPLLRIAADGPAWPKAPLFWWKELGKASPPMPVPIVP